MCSLQSQALPDHRGVLFKSITPGHILDIAFDNPSTRRSRYSHNIATLLPPPVSAIAAPEKAALCAAARRCWIPASPQFPLQIHSLNSASVGSR